MEQLLHYCWKHKMWLATGLETTDGRIVEVLDPGLHNRYVGPDFFNAKNLFQFLSQLTYNLRNFS